MGWLMFHRLAITSSCIAGMALTQVAVAADLPRKAPADTPQPAVFGWTGIYIGGHIGGAWANVDWTHSATVLETFAQDTSSLAGGVHAGAMYQWGTAVIGIEGTYAWHDLSQTSVSISTLIVDRSSSFDSKNMATVVGRLGWAWDRWLVYGQSGWAAAKTDFRRFSTTTNANTASSSKWDDGWTVGVGTAYAIWNNVNLGIQYDFVRIDIDNRSSTVTPGFLGPSILNARSDIHQVTARLSFKFP